jgi:hypothetical protein
MPATYFEVPGNDTALVDAGRRWLGSSPVGLPKWTRLFIGSGGGGGDVYVAKFSAGSLSG